MIAGAAVLGGWMFGIERLADFTYDGITMKANTALALAAAGAALLLLSTESLNAWRRWTGRALAASIILLATLTLSEHIFGLNLHIDQVLAAEPVGEPATVSPGRMGPPAATAYTLIGIALLLMSWNRRKLLLISQTLCLASVILALLSLVGNLYGAGQLFAFARYTGISRQTALLLLILAVGVLCAQPRSGIMSVFSSEEAGGVILRRLIIPSLAFPIVFGRVCLYGISAGWFDASFGIALFAILLAFALVAVAWWDSSGLNVLSSRRREAEQELERLLESERCARMEMERSARLKEEFLATVSHELRTPVNAIIGWTHILQRKGIDSDMVGKAVEVIDRNARIQSELISDLLDMSSIISGKMSLKLEQLDLDVVILAAIESVRPTAEQKGVSIRTDLSPMNRLVTGDPARLQQVLWNLLANAVKFTPRGGSVRVRLTRQESTATIIVSDTGQGIAPEFLPHVFDRFRQADASITRLKGGLGLGLAIVKELVELHGGRVSIQSDGVGRGVTCTVELPIPAESHPATFDLKRAAPAPPVEQTAATPDLKHFSILVLEDDPDAREYILRILSDCGANAVGAASAEEAFQVVNGRRPNLIVSDIGLPSISGYEVMKQLRAQGVTTPAIALTAYARPEDKVSALAAGFQSHLTKPVEPAELLATVTRLLASQSRTDQVAS